MMTLTQFHNIIGGQEQAARASFETYDPYTGKPWALIPADGVAEVDQAVAAAKAASCASCSMAQMRRCSAVGSPYT